MSLIEVTHCLIYLNSDQNTQRSFVTYMKKVLASTTIAEATIGRLIPNVTEPSAEKSQLLVAVITSRWQ